MTIIQHESHSVFQENTYIIKKNNEVLIIDPGDAPDRILSYLELQACIVKGVLATHGHIDHVLGAAPLCEKFACPFIMNSTDQGWLDKLEMMCDQFDLDYLGKPTIGIDVKEKDEIQVDGFSFRVLHTPGHTQGGVCYLFGDVVFSGDTLFYHSVGRTDLPGGDMSVLKKSIKDKLFSLADDTIVYPGHLGKTSIREEKKHNPFVIL